MGDALVVLLLIVCGALFLAMIAPRHRRYPGLPDNGRLRDEPYPRHND